MENVYFHIIRFQAGMFLLALLAACATPAQRADSAAAGFGFTRALLLGSDFRHVTYSHPGIGSTLHVYLESDGTPWLARYVVASDPTPRHPLILELMALDKAPSLYLGRPCYFGEAQTPSCTPLTWTDERYSARVVDSLAAALRRYLQQTPYAEVALFGLSGGGTLAVLLAERIPETFAVVTLAANLDVGAWTAYHGYSPLTGSLDPARQAPLDPRILQWHYVGGRDSNVPPGLIQAYSNSRPAVRTTEIPLYNHVCCWPDVWPEILKELSQSERKSALPGR